MAEITRAQLDAYIDDALSEQETAQVEQALRQSESLRLVLRAVLQERDRGDHSIGAIWRRQRLSCPAREQLGSYLLQVREPDWSTIFDWDAAEAARSRRGLLGKVADTGTFVLPIHFPHPTTGLVAADGARFRYTFAR